MFLRPSLSLVLASIAALPDDDRLALARRGDPAAVRALYQEHAHAVRAFARRVLGDVDLAEDVVHDVFLDLPAALERFRGDGPLGTYLLSIAARRAKNLVRASIRRRAAAERLASEPARGESTPEALALRAELAGALMRAMDELPFEQRVAFVLCEVEERTAREASAILGASDATVRARVMYAKRRLRESLRGEDR